MRGREEERMRGREEERMRGEEERKRGREEERKRGRQELSEIYSRLFLFRAARSSLYVRLSDTSAGGVCMSWLPEP